MDIPLPHLDKQVFIDPHSTLPKTYFQLMEKVGSGGKYQRNLFYIFLLVYLVTGSVLLSTSFIFLNNRYVCDEEGLLVTTCKKSICEIQNLQQRKKYFVRNTEDIDSIATQFGPFMCDDQFQLDMLKSCPYFGSFIGFIVFSYISDNFGRRTTMILSLGLGSLGSILIATGFNIVMIAIGVVMAGAGINASSGIVMYFLGQTVQNLKRQKYSILVQTSYTFGAMIITGLYYLLSQWRVIAIIMQVVPILITFFLFAFYVEQTPLFLLKGKNKEALRALNRIGYINFGIKDIVTEEDIQNVRNQQLENEDFIKIKVSPLDLLRFGSLRSTTIVSCLLCYCIFTMYYGPSLIIDSIGFNMYVSNFVILLSQLIGYIPCYYYIQKLKRKPTGFALFLIVIVTTFILSLIKKPQGCDMCTQSIIEVIVVFIFRFAAAIQFIFFLVYCIELFPARIVGIGVGVVNAFGTIASTLSPIILGALQRIDFNLMLLFFILGIIGLILTVLLDQTYGKPLKVEIDEVFYAKNKRKTQYISQIRIQSGVYIKTSKTL